MMHNTQTASALLTTQLKALVYATASRLYPDAVAVQDVVVERPRDSAHGDYATTVALVLSKRLKKNPREIAKELSAALQRQLSVVEAGVPHRNTGKSTQNKSQAHAKKKHFETEYAADNIASSIEKVSVAGQGFINIHLSQKFLVTQLKRVLTEKNLDGSDRRILAATGLPLAGKRIMVEYTDPNPFKEFHIGHLYSNIVGETLCRLLEACGAEVARADYFGDVGMHVAKSLYGFFANSKPKTQNSERIRKTILELEQQPIGERVKLLGQAYAAGAAAYEADTDAAAQIKRLNFLIYIAAQRRLEAEEGWRPQVDYTVLAGEIDEDELAAVQALFAAGRRWSLEYFETQYRRLDTGYVSQRPDQARAFDYYYPESQAGEHGIRLVRDGLKQGIFEKSRGAVVFRGERHGLHTRVFINALGLPTYEAKELGLAPVKYADVAYDASIIVTGNEINEYFAVLITALKQIMPTLGEKTRHIGHGMVRLPEGKMSSRTGNVITAQWLMDEAVRRAREIAVEKGILAQGGRQRVVKKTHIVGGQQAQEVTGEHIGIGAVKYALLKSKLGGDIAFDFAESLSFDGDSGPYLQYTYARARSVLRKSGSVNKHFDSASKRSQQPNTDHTQPGARLREPSQNVVDAAFSDDKLNTEERTVLGTLYRFSEVVVEAADTYSPHLACGYLYELAGAFNAFYHKHTILPSRGTNQHFDSASKRSQQPNTDHTQPGARLREPSQNVVDAAQTADFRLALTQAVATTLKNGLTLLGIAAPERM